MRSCIQMQGERGATVTGPPGDQGAQGERGSPGPIIDATGREVNTVKGEKVSEVTKTFAFVTDAANV